MNQQNQLVTQGWDMIYEEINEVIDVITVFQRGALEPLRFKWKNEVYKVSQIYSKWTVPATRGKTHHFTVSAGSSDSFELVFNTESLNWQLARVALDG